LKNKKQFFEKAWVREDLVALRSEEPDSAAVQRAVSAMQTAPTRTAARSPWVWRATAAAAAAAAVAVLVFSAAPRSASADILKQIETAVKGQRTCHMKTFRHNSQGEMQLMLEDWIDGVRNKSVETKDGSVTEVGYDGRLMFRVGANGSGFVDDVEPNSTPVSSIDDLLGIPGGKLAKQEPGVKADGQTVDLYVITFSNVRFDLYVDPTTRLPAKRVVTDSAGNFIEENDYDYPASIPDSTFEPPSGSGQTLCDYPKLRKQVSQLLQGPGETQTVGGVEVRLLAVLAGDRSLLAVWTGGSQPGSDPKNAAFPADAMTLAGVTFKDPNQSPPPQTPFQTFCTQALNNEASSVFPSGGPFYGLIAWYQDEITVGSPLTLQIPVWSGSKFVGYAKFTVNDVVVGGDPQRVLWKPDSQVRATTSAK
jgi:hypothetical protein